MSVRPMGLPAPDQYGNYYLGKPGCAPAILKSAAQAKAGKVAYFILLPGPRGVLMEERRKATGAGPCLLKEGEGNHVRGIRYFPEALQALYHLRDLDVVVV